MHLDIIGAADLSRRDTSHERAYHLSQLSLGASLGSRGWVHRNLTIRIAESRADRAEVADVVKRRHYLRRWPAPPRTLLLSYIADLGGEGAAAITTVALLPANLGGLVQALDIHPCSVLTLARSWRADDLTPDVAPDLMPEVLRRVVKRVATEWAARKCQRLQARPRLLVTYADPEVGHDGNLYLGAGAVALGGKSKLLFAWPLDPDLRAPLRNYAARARA